MNIRPARAEDYPAYCALFNEINDFHAAARPEMFKSISSAPRSLDEYQAILSDPAEEIFLAWAGDQAAGYIHMLLRDTPSVPILIPRRFGVVDTVMVAGPFKRQGIGKALMAEGEAWALQRGAATVELNVFEFNQGAIQFYEELGYHNLSRKMRKQI